jgi:hypothetical protein
MVGLLGKPSCERVGHCEKSPSWWLTVTNIVAILVIVNYQQQEISDEQPTP